MIFDFPTEVLEDVLWGPSVSYTHLDVYKRQVLKFSKMSSGVPRCPSPVSYTHLDVYKRQSHTSPPPARNSS